MQLMKVLLGSQSVTFSFEAQKHLAMGHEQLPLVLLENVFERKKQRQPVKFAR